MKTATRFLTIAAALCFALVPCLLMLGCAADVKQRQRTDVTGVTAEGGLNNVTETTPGRAQSGVNYPATTLASNEAEFAATGPGSQTTIFNPSFGSIMVAGTLKADKFRAWVNPDGDDELTAEGVLIDNSANAAPAWAKAIENQAINSDNKQKEIAVEQLKTFRETATGLAKIGLDALIAAFNPAAGAASVLNPSGPIVVPAPPGP